MKVLELFSGTKSFKKAIFKKYPEAEVISLDFEKKYNPDILIDILEWDYKSIKDIDIIWASPNCKEYSLAKSKGIRDLDYADSLVKKALEIIEWFQPKYWFIENPDTGLLKTRPFMKDLPYYVVDYCQYDRDEKKPTRIYTNLKNFIPKRCCRKTCDKIVKIIKNDKDSFIHKGQYGSGKNKKFLKEQLNINYKDKYEDIIAIPQPLLKEFIELF